MVTEEWGQHLIACPLVNPHEWPSLWPILTETYLLQVQSSLAFQPATWKICANHTGNFFPTTPSSFCGSIGNRDYVPGHMKNMCINRTTQFNQNIIKINYITWYSVCTQTEIHVALTPPCVIAQLGPCHTRKLSKHLPIYRKKWKLFIYFIHTL